MFIYYYNRKKIVLLMQESQGEGQIVCKGQQKSALKYGLSNIVNY